MAPAITSVIISPMTGAQLRFATPGLSRPERNLAEV